MQIIGNVKTANKFYVTKEDGSIEWIDNLILAKRYVENPKNKNWFNKDLYATNEDVVKAENGKLYLRSQKPKLDTKEHINSYNTFSKSIYTYINCELNDLVEKLGYTSVTEAISWYNSKLKDKKDTAKKILAYRDNLYTYANTILETNKQALKEDTENSDFSTLYTSFINNLPKF